MDPRAARTKARQSWTDMRRRCNDPKAKGYQYYGKRGIRVASEFETFEGFLAHVGLPPSPHHTLDRIAFNDHYRPGNVRWATISEQNRNQRNTVVYYYQGKTQCLTAWAEELGVPFHALNRRLKFLGWSVERALSTPVRPWGKRRVA